MTRGEIQNIDGTAKRPKAEKPKNQAAYSSSPASPVVFKNKTNPKKNKTEKIVSETQPPIKKANKHKKSPKPTVADTQNPFGHKTQKQGDNKPQPTSDKGNENKTISDKEVSTEKTSKNSKNETIVDTKASRLAEIGFSIDDDSQPIIDLPNAESTIADKILPKNKRKKDHQPAKNDSKASDSDPEVITSQAEDQTNSEKRKAPKNSKKDTDRQDAPKDNTERQDVSEEKTEERIEEKATEPETSEQDVLEDDATKQDIPKDNPAPRSQPKPKPKKRKSSHFRSVVTMANTKLPIKFAALVLSGSTLISALLGIFRDRLLNSYYLDTYPTGIDAYTAAFTIPDFMFFLLTSGALSVSFIPVFNQRLGSGNKKSAWELSSSLLNLMALITLAASLLIILLADPLVRYVVGPGLDESGMILAINMMRVIAINPFLFAISTILSSIQQALGRFVFCALAPALYNVGILIGITVFTNGINIFGWQIFEGGIMGVALGVVFGAILQLIVSLMGLFGLGFDYRFKMNWKNQGFRAVLKLLPARSLDQGIDYVNTIVTTNLSSRMGAGALRCYQQAYNLSQMPVNLIGVAISTAFFPKLTEETGTGQEEKFRQTFRTALSTIIWVSLPVTMIALFTRGYVVSFIKNGGDAVISSVLATLVLSIFAHSIFHIASRGFYAHQDTKTPLIISIAAIGATILLAIVFTFMNCGPDGLGWAQSIGAVLEIIVLIAILQRRSNGKLLDREFWKDCVRTIIATIITSLVTYSTTKIFPLMASDDSIFIVFPKFALICVLSFGVYLIAGYFLGIKQVKPIVERTKKIVFRNLS